MEPKSEPIQLTLDVTVMLDLRVAARRAARRGTRRTRNQFGQGRMNAGTAAAAAARRRILVRVRLDQLCRQGDFLAHI